MAKKLQTPTPAPSSPPPQALPGALQGAYPTEADDIQIGGGAAEVLPRTPPTAPFLLAWHPARWTVSGGRLIPALRHVPLQPGINRVVKGRDGRYQLGDARSHLERRGWMLIPREAGPGGQSYLTRTRTSLGPQGSYTYHLIFERLYPGTDQIGSDQTAYLDWVASLVGRLIPPCPGYVAVGLREQKQGQLPGYERRVREQPSFQPTLDALLADIATLDAYLDSLTTTLSPAAPSAGEDLALEGL